MAKPKRTAEERERDLVVVARMFCRGVSQVKMAATMEVARSQIQYDIAILLDRWGKLEQENVRSQELAKINQLESTYWDAWEQSLTAKKQRRKVRRTGGPSPGDSREIRVERRDGNPEFLRGVQWCIEQRCRILGLIVNRVQHSGDGENPVNVSVTILTDDQRAAHERSIIARLGHRGLAPGTNGHHQLPGPAQG